MESLLYPKMTEISAEDEEVLAHLERSLQSSLPSESYGFTANLYSPPKDQLHELRDIQLPDRVPTPMDFSTFRESGELSDITIQVDEREFKLHKFPLYTRSDFFRALARSDSGVVKLDEFPGGAETFEMVANFCYNKRIDVNKDNICRLRCAAEFLQMCSPGNLADCADRYLVDVLTTAKLSRDIEVIISIIMSARHLGAIAEQANIIDRCVNSIVDCWLLSSKWTRRAPSDKMLIESPSFKKLSRFPLAWFKKLFIAARDKNVRGSLLARLVQSYISDKIKKKEKREEINEDEKEEEVTDPADQDSDDSLGSPVDDVNPMKDINIIKDQDGVGDNKDIGEDNKDNENPKESKSEDEKERSDARKEEGEEQDDKEEEETEEEEPDEEEDEEEEDEDVDIGVIMDTLLLELPDRATLSDTLEPKWAAAMLRVADELKCQCRDLLLKIVSRILFQFDSEDLGRLSPDLLEEIIKEAAKDPIQIDQDSVCAVVDSYLLELADKDKLSVDVFNQMASSIAQDHRQNHDILFKVLEKMLKSDAIKIEDDDKEALLDNVDFRRLSESALQNAYESQLVPDPYVTKAALALCAKLRHELETARDIIRAQEEELEKYGTIGGRPTLRASSWLHGVESDYGLSATHHDVDLPSRDLHSHHDLQDDLDHDSLRYSPPGVDPILEKGLGGQYFSDPFHVDAYYPYCYHHTRRSYYEDSDVEPEPSYDSGYYPRYTSSSYGSTRSPMARSYKW